MLARYCGPGLLGLGITALIAGFMSGMAGNVSAFATVWTYDIYRALIPQGRHRCALRHRRPLVHHPRRAGQHRHRLPGDAVRQHHGLCAGAVQLLHRAAVRHRACSACSGSAPRPPAASGDCSSAPLLDRHVGLGEGRSERACAISRSRRDAKDMAENMYRALWSWIICVVVTVVVSLVTTPKPEAELVGLVYGAPKFRPRAICPCINGRYSGPVSSPWSLWF